MVVIYYDSDTPAAKLRSQLQSIREYVKNTFNEDVLALPKNFDILQDCSYSQLMYIRNSIDKALQEKRIKDGVS